MARMVRWLTAGESHGPSLVAVIEGLPAGIQVTSKDIEAALARRRLGYGRGARQKFEQDALEILGGVRHGVTIGSPIALEIGNSEWPKWSTVMSPDPVEAAAFAAADDVNAPQEIARNRPLTRPRPGHADLVGMQKYGFDDARPVLERASARFISLSRAKGSLPHLRMTAALSDGHRLYAVRYATDENAPSLYYRWSATRGGMAVVSEPLEAEEGGWNEVPTASFCTFEGEAVKVEEFMPCRLAAAA